MISLLDKAALSLHKGFLTSALGNRGAVITFILLMSLLPDSLGFCFWLGPGVYWKVSPSQVHLSSPEFLALDVMLSLVGVAGMYLTLRKMAARRPVRSA